MALNKMFENMWRDYTSLNPRILDIEDVFKKRGETLTNDHVAFRTFNTKELGLENFKSFFLKNGYEVKGEYHFKVKKLFAQHLEHSSGKYPKIFISELLCEQLSEKTQKTIQSLVAQTPKDFHQSETFCISGRPWKISHKEYAELLEESEYAAWMAAFGFRVNHFTVLVNELKTLKNVSEVNAALTSTGFRLNASGGDIKGSEQVGLMQSSTMAVDVPVEFTEGLRNIPGCYYEFAQRFPVNGKLYSGFVEQSADKIFESTNVSR
ncbi:MAG: DUF1338 domain-containing protein [Bdellovibrionaceae bacterium]|nr:DUF1338 domain-containing protein [Pseudobdellovibrionaceae bacterium]